MNNQQYVASLGVDEATQRETLAAMEKYHGNHWWEPDVDLRTFACYQVNEAIFLSGDRERIEEAFRVLLGRPVYNPMVELHPANLEFLRDEAERA